MSLPTLTHLQFLIIEILGGRERSGRDVRAALEERGVGKSLAAFYQLMSRMEDAKFVTGKYHTVKIGTQEVQERRYKVTAGGRRAYEAQRDFYAGRDGAAAVEGGLA